MYGDKIVLCTFFKIINRMRWISHVYPTLITFLLGQDVFDRLKAAGPDDGLQVVDQGGPSTAFTQVTLEAA